MEAPQRALFVFSSSWEAVRMLLKANNSLRMGVSGSGKLITLDPSIKLFSGKDARKSFLPAVASGLKLRQQVLVTDAETLLDLWSQLSQEDPRSLLQALKFKLEKEVKRNLPAAIVVTPPLITSCSSH